MAADFLNEHIHLPFYLICILYRESHGKKPKSISSIKMTVKRKGMQWAWNTLLAAWRVYNSVGDYFLKTRKEGFKKTSLLFHTPKLKFQLLFGAKSSTIISLLQKKTKTTTIQASLLLTLVTGDLSEYKGIHLTLVLCMHLALALPQAFLLRLVPNLNEDTEIRSIPYQLLWGLGGSAALGG